MTPDRTPTVEEQLHDALHEVAQCVTVDQLPALWTDDDRSPPRVRRTRILATVFIGAALATGAVVAVKATSSTGGARHPASTVTTTPARAPFVDEGALTTARYYSQGLTVLLPPPRGSRPRVTADQAYAVRSGYPWRREPASPHLVLADVSVYDYGTAHNDGSVTPFIDQRLMWVVTYADVPSGSLRANNGKPSPRSGKTTTSTAPIDPNTRSGSTVLILVDATTGKPVEAEGLPGSFSTAPSLSCSARAPRTVPRHQLAGTESTFVPGNPIELLACRYHGLNQPQAQGSFARSARLAPLSIVDALNEQRLIPNGAVSDCPADFGETIRVMLGYANGSRLTLSVDTAGCRDASNGDRAVATPQAVLSQLQDVVGQDHEPS